MDLKYVSKDQREKLIRETALSAEIDAHRDEVEVLRLEALLRAEVEGVTIKDIEDAEARATISREEAAKLARKVELKDADARKEWAADVLRWRRGWLAGDPEIGQQVGAIQNTEQAWTKVSAYSPDYLVNVGNGARVKAGMLAQMYDVGHAVMMQVLAELPSVDAAPPETKGHGPRKLASVKKK